MILAEHDIDTLKQLPDEWFYPSELTSLKQAVMRCDQLISQGYLETRKKVIEGSVKLQCKKVSLTSSNGNPFVKYDHLEGVARLVSSAKERIQMVMDFNFHKLNDVARNFISVPVQKSVLQQARQRLVDWPKDAHGDYIIPDQD